MDDPKEIKKQQNEFERDFLQKVKEYEKTKGNGKGKGEGDAKNLGRRGTRRCIMLVPVLT